MNTLWLKRFFTMVVSGMLLLPCAGHADAVLDWNEIALAQVTAAKQLAPDAARTMAIAHVAMFDAVNAVDRRYAAYAFDERAAVGTSLDAAVAAAANAVLVALLPGQRASIAAAYDRFRAGLPEVAATRDGLALGARAAERALVSRANDGADAMATYVPYTTPGVYVPTALPVSTQWGRVKPWFLHDGAQVRPGPPPALDSPRWQSDYEEIKAVGAKKSTLRSADQTDMAQFWAVTGPASWNPVVRVLATSRPRDAVANARLFALVNMAAMDAFIAVFDAKYTYRFWRPITAIRNARDGDPAWLPLIDTPMHPEYPCAHCITAAAVGEVVKAEFGTGEVAPIAMTSPTAPGVSRSWSRIDDYVTEVANARVWGGIHYRNSTEVGRVMGQRIGAIAATKLPRSR
ncbi:MAG: vanadium-dependent haloperoxidase [Proteobacteria bacterium]|nr:vanadium-dependent haloperoxidase [Pseudomonadota bacterium]